MIIFQPQPNEVAGLKRRIAQLGEVDPDHVQYDAESGRWTITNATRYLQEILDDLTSESLPLVQSASGRDFHLRKLRL